MIRSSDALVWRALRVVILLICSMMFVVLPMAVLADGTGPEPPIKSLDPVPSSGGDGITPVVVTLLAVLWSMP